MFHLNHASDDGEEVLNIRQVNKFAYSLSEIAKSEQKRKDGLDQDLQEGSLVKPSSAMQQTATVVQIMNDEEEELLNDNNDLGDDDEDGDDDGDDERDPEAEDDEDDPNEEVSQMIETNEIPQKSKSDRHHRRHHHHRPNSLSNLGMHSLRRGGYHASSAPTDFLKKRYKSEFLEV